MYKLGAFAWSIAAFEQRGEPPAWLLSNDGYTGQYDTVLKHWMFALFIAGWLAEATHDVYLFYVRQKKDKADIYMQEDGFSW